MQVNDAPLSSASCLELQHISSVDKETDQDTIPTTDSSSQSTYNKKSTMTVPAVSVENVWSKFIKGSGMLKGCRPGFAHAMKLSYNTMEKSRLTGGPTSLTYRYKLSPDVPKFTVGLLTSLMDELSTDACYHVGAPSPPGLSLQMQTELTPNAELENLEEVDIINYVTKLGKKISFTRTDFRCSKTNELIGFSSHVKYMPTGSWVLDLLFNKPMVANFYYWLKVRDAQIPFYDEKPIFDVIKQNMEFQGLGHATFHVTKEHTNPFGSLHGGCHAMIMEQMAETYAKEELACGTVIVQSMQVEYLGAGKGSLDVVCETLGKSTEDGTIQVRVQLKNGKRVSSQGTLHLVALKSRL